MRKEFDPIEVTTSVHDQKCIQIENPSSIESKIIRGCVLENRMDTEEYKNRTKAGSFLQCDYPDYILVEFWSNNYQPFVDMINRKFREEKEKLLKVELINDDIINLSNEISMSHATQKISAGYIEYLIKVWLRNNKNVDFFINEGDLNGV